MVSAGADDLLHRPDPYIVLPPFRLDRRADPVTLDNQVRTEVAAIWGEIDRVALLPEVSGPPLLELATIHQIDIGDTRCEQPIALPPLQHDEHGESDRREED